MFFFMIFFMILKKRQFNRRVKYMIIWWNGLKKWNLASDFTSGDSASLYIRHFAKKKPREKINLLSENKEYVSVQVRPSSQRPLYCCYFDGNS
jgi:hypothetical protein